MIVRIGVVTVLAWTAGAAPAIANCTVDAAVSRPATITRGGEYTGNWESSDPNVPALQILTAEPVTIIRSRFSGSGDLLVAVVPRSNVTVRDSCFKGTHPITAGTGRGRAVVFFAPANVVIEHNEFESVGGYAQGMTTGGNGIMVNDYRGDFSSSNSIKIRFNRFRNLDARFSDGAGGFLTDRTCQWSVGIQLIDVLNVPGIEVAWNEIVNEPYLSGIGDSINLYDSGGTPASPALIHDNYVQGGWDSDPKKGSEFTYYGSAITTDGNYQTDPRLTTSFMKIYDNQAVGFGNLGISIALGHDIEMFNNRAVSDGLLDDGTPASTFYSIGIQHINWRNNPPETFFNTSVHDNVSGVRRHWEGQWLRFDYNFTARPTIDINNQHLPPHSAAAPTLADELNEHARWRQKLEANKVRIGPPTIDAQKK